MCIQQSSLGQRKNECIIQLTAYLRSVDPHYQLQSVMVYILLLTEGNLLENIVVTLLCFGAFVTISSYLVHDLIA